MIENTRNRFNFFVAGKPIAQPRTKSRSWIDRGKIAELLSSMVGQRVAKPIRKDNVHNGTMITVKQARTAVKTLHYTDQDKIGPWKNSIEAASRRIKAELGLVIVKEPMKAITEPVAVNLTFFMPRPAYHFGTGKNAGTLKRTAPMVHTKKPDFDNLIKAVCDAMVDADLLADDNIVCKWSGVKLYAPLDAEPGVQITITRLDENGEPKIEELTNS